MLRGVNSRRHSNGMHHSASVKTMTLGEGVLALQRFDVEPAHLESLGGPRWSGSGAKRDLSNEDVVVVRKPPTGWPAVPFGMRARAGAIVVSMAACSRPTEPPHLFACGPSLCATGIEFCEYPRSSVPVPKFPLPPAVVAPSVVGQAACTLVPTPCRSDPTWRRRTATDTGRLASRR
jgi:hypothetical protein